MLPHPVDIIIRGLVTFTKVVDAAVVIGAGVDEPGGRDLVKIVEAALGLGFLAGDGESRQQNGGEQKEPAEDDDQIKKAKRGP